MHGMFYLLHTFLNPPPPLPPIIFYSFTLPLEILDKTKLQPLEILQNSVTPLGNSKAKNQDPWKFHMIFSSSPLEIPLRF